MAAEACSLLLSVLTQTAAMYGASVPAVLIYMIGNGLHVDEQIDPRLRSLLLQAARSKRCCDFLGKVHLLEGTAVLSEAQEYHRKNTAASLVGGTLVFMIARSSTVVQPPRKTERVFSTLAKIYLLSSRLRSDRPVLTLKTQVEVPVEGQVSTHLFLPSLPPPDYTPLLSLFPYIQRTVPNDVKRAMLLPFIRDRQGRLLPVVFVDAKEGVNYYRIRHLLTSRRTSLDEILRDPKLQQILLYALDLQLRQYLVHEKNVSSRKSIETVWNMFTALGLHCVDTDENVVSTNFAILQYLCYELPDTPQARKKVVTQKLEAMAPLGRGVYVTQPLQKAFTMSELVAGLGPTTVEQVLGLPALTLQIVRDKDTPAYQRAQQMLALPNVDIAKTSAARMQSYEMKIPHATSRTGFANFHLDQGLRLATLFKLKLPKSITSVPIDKEYVCMICSQLILNGSEDDFEPSCCAGAHTCRDCLTLALQNVFVPGHPVNRGVAKCTSCFSLLHMQDMQELVPRVATMFQALSDLVLENHPELKAEIKEDLVKVLGKHTYVVCDAPGCERCFYAGPYDCSTHGSFTTCPVHRHNNEDLKECPACGKQWGPPLYCHHATCDSDLEGCGAHWCWTCTGDNWPGYAGERMFDLDTDGPVYDHMTAVHGSWHGEE